MSFPTRRTIKFIYSADIAYVLEFGEQFIRAYYADEYVTSVSAPYLEEHLFELQYNQLGDVMRITHPKYKPRKLIRTSATTFTLTEVEINNGPFRVRNDLIDPFDTDPSTMSCSATAVGSFGNLVCSAEVFESGHVGALFKLTHPRATKIVSSAGPDDSSAIYIKGSGKLITRGTWTGTFHLLRNENSAGWETYRTYKGSSGAEQNISLPIKEEADNVQFMIDATTTDAISSKFRADLTSEEMESSGIVKVFAYGTTRLVSVEVITRLESTDATRKWAEGSWSDYRGWPASLTFYEDRCVYAGALSGSEGAFNTSVMYPVLKTANYGS